MTHDNGMYLFAVFTEGGIWTRISDRVSGEKIIIHRLEDSLNIFHPDSLEPIEAHGLIMLLHDDRYPGGISSEVSRPIYPKSVRTLESWSTETAKLLILGDLMGREAIPPPGSFPDLEAIIKESPLHTTIIPSDFPNE